jgi:molybdopterin synthase catalytic subunit
MSKPVRVLFFSILKDIAGAPNLEVDVPEGATVQGLKDVLVRKIPGLKNALDTAVVSINLEFAFDEDPLPEKAEVAFFPPVSGGSDFPTITLVTEDEIDINDLVAQITLPTTGAACIFTGVVRGVTKRGDPHETVRLEYEAYAPMAEAKMKQVADEIREKYPVVEGVAIVQRVGLLLPKEPTTLVACTSAHRDDGVFEAARYGIDRLKEIVPVWKKEVGPNGGAWVEGKYHPGKED